MKRTPITEITGQESAGGRFLVQGWVKTRRVSKTVAFIQVNDGSTLSDLQVVADESTQGYDLVEPLTTGCSVSVEGTLVESLGKGQRYELKAEAVELLGTADPDTYPLQKKRHTLEFLREIAHLRPRTNTLGATARVRSAAAFAIHSFFQSKGFSTSRRPSSPEAMQRAPAPCSA